MQPALPYMLDNPNSSRWYYRDEPAAGAIIGYIRENFIDVVERVTLTQVWLVSGRALWRPYISRRIVRWSIERVLNKLTQKSYSAPDTGRATLRYDPAV